ncbi:non-symbiotic hemoglobin 2 [Senna tora]|uniref:Non-symbiotic hemoglobin 2 n=1 Tax=Senna tora TaxID=362788 RepID=A0A834SYJ3_9FABA|nr:non-symbiotic hemoglobin 2 [Senna tora]
MLSFLRDTNEIPKNNPKLKAHAVKVFNIRCEERERKYSAQKLFRLNKE